MKQVKIDNVLYVLSIVPYQITQDTSVETIYINCNYLDEFKELNPDLELVPYNYRLLRKSQPPYMPYVDVPDFVDFEFDSSIQNVSSMVDETKTMTLQELHLPDDYTGTVTYKLDGVLLDSSIFTLYDASLYEVLAEISGTSLYEQDTASYQIIYSKDKYNAEISFAQSTVNVSSYVDSSYTGNIQQVQNAPENVDIKYYLNNSLLDSSVINLTEAGQYQMKAAIVSDELYNDTSTTYTINYVKNKRNATLSFANAVVEETVEDVTEYSGNVQFVSGAPSGVSINYYLGNTLLSNGQIEIDNLEEGENTFTIYAKLENNPVYNNAQASYNLVVTMEISSYANKYFTIEPLEDGTIQFTKNDLQYSTDNKKTWNTLTKDTSLNVTTGNNVLFKCANPTNNNGIGIFSSSGQFNASGNIMSLLFGDNFKNQTTIQSDKQLQYLFLNSKIVNAENLILPATTLKSRCYFEMFLNCSLLTIAPELPATTLAQECYGDMFAGSSKKDLINIRMLATNISAYNCLNGFIRNYNLYLNKQVGTFVKSKYLTNIQFQGSMYTEFESYYNGIPYYWKVINYETNKEVYPLRFNKSTVNVSTYTNQNYTGTILTATSNRTIPNGLVKYYLDSSLLAGNNITLTTPGNHTVLAEIVADTSIDDSSASYTITYTQEKRDITFSATWSKQPDANGYEVGDSEYCPSPTMHQSPSSPSASPSALYNILDSSDNPLFSWSAGWPNDSKLYTTAAGTYSCAVKYTISSFDANYKATEQICKWTYTVNAAHEQSSPYYVDLEAYVYGDGEEQEEQAYMHLYSGYDITGATTFQKIVPIQYDEHGNLIEGEPYNLSTIDENGGNVELAGGSYKWRVYLNSSIVPANAFTYCDQYTFITLNGIQEVGNNAFDGCACVQDVYFNEGLKIIGSRAFYAIDSAENTGINIILPDSITAIGDEAFREIFWQVFIIASTTPPTLGNEAFSDLDMLEESNCTIQVPSGSVNAYKTAPGWSTYASIIVPME